MLGKLQNIRIPAGQPGKRLPTTTTYSLMTMSDLVSLNQQAPRVPNSALH